MIFADGFRNRKESGYTLCNDKGELIIRAVVPGITNNEAELLGIEHATLISPPGEEVRTDSQVCCQWIKNWRSDARQDLNPLIRTIRLAIDEKGITLRWVRREQNLAGVWNEKHG